MRAFILVALLLSTMALALAVPTVTFENTEIIADKVNVMVLSFDGEITPASTYQFGHKTLCSFIRESNIYTVDEINTCTVDGEVVGEIDLPKEDDACYPIGPDAFLAFSFNPTVDKIAAGAKIKCTINFAVAPTIGKSDTEPILFRAVPADTPDEQTTESSPLTSNYPLIKEEDERVAITVASVDHAASSIKYSITLSAAGSYKIDFSSKPAFANAPKSIYCYKDAETDRDARFFAPDQTSLYIHHRYLPKYTQNTPLICTIQFAVAKIETITATIGKATAQSPLYPLADIGFPTITVADVEVPTVAEVVFDYFVPKGTAKGSTFYTTLTDVLKSTAADFKTDKTKLLKTYFTGFKYAEAIANFEYLPQSVEQDFKIGISYTAEAATAEDQIISVKLSYDKSSFPAQADIQLLTGVSNLPAQVVEEYRDVLKVFDQTGSIMYLRAVLRNKMLKNELIDNGYTLSVTTQVTAQLNTMDFAEGNGWLTIFYMTDSYNDVDREYTCKLTRDGKVFVVPVTHVDFGTLHVFTKEVLKPGESLTISCNLPILYKDLTGYLPLPDARQLRIATWSYDKTTDDGADIFEGNNGHAITPLKPIDADHSPVAVFSFMVPPTAINFEKDLLTHMVKVLETLARLKDDAEPPASIFPPGDLHPESIYSIINYQIRNTTGFKRAPYDAVEVNSVLAVAGVVSFAVDVDKTYTVEHYQSFIAKYNTALASLNSHVFAVVADRAYLSSSGLNNCGSPMARKCLFGGFATQHSCCGGDGEATEMEDGTTVCWNGGVAYNPFAQSSATSSLSLFFALIIALVAICLH